jgi:hypothetical protein
MNRDAEVNRLNEADNRIARAERAVSKQLALIAAMKEVGHDTNEAAKQLRDFEATLVTLREHRGLIVKMIEQIDAGLA